MLKPKIVAISPSVSHGLKTAFTGLLRAATAYTAGSLSRNCAVWQTLLGETPTNMVTLAAEGAVEGYGFAEILSGLSEIAASVTGSTKVEALSQWALDHRMAFATVGSSTRVMGYFTSSFVESQGGWRRLWEGSSSYFSAEGHPRALQETLVCTETYYANFKDGQSLSSHNFSEYSQYDTWDNNGCSVGPDSLSVGPDGACISVTDGSPTPGKICEFGGLRSDFPVLDGQCVDATYQMTTPLKSGDINGGMFLMDKWQPSGWTYGEIDSLEVTGKSYPNGTGYTNIHGAAISGDYSQAVTGLNFTNPISVSLCRNGSEVTFFIQGNPIRTLTNPIGQDFRIEYNAWVAAPNAPLTYWAGQPGNTVSFRSCLQEITVRNCSINTTTPNGTNPITQPPETSPSWPEWVIPVLEVGGGLTLLICLGLYAGKNCRPQAPGTPHPQIPVNIEMV